jgi:hypothetical protein
MKIPIIDLTWPGEAGAIKKCCFLAPLAGSKQGHEAASIITCELTVEMASYHWISSC